MTEDTFLKEGKFYFWRNLFLSVIVSIFMTIGAAVAFSFTLFRSVENCSKNNEKSIAITQTDVKYFREEQREMKKDIKEDFKELKQLVKEK